MDLDRSQVFATVTEWGGPTNQAAIILRSLDIPAVTGLIGIRDRIQSGQRLLVNGELGTVILKPTEAELTRFVGERRGCKQAVSAMAIVRESPA